jgi:hypothetical protein
MVVDGLQSMLVIRAHALNVAKWVIGPGLLNQLSQRCE